MNIDDFISSTSETMNTDIDNMDVLLNYDNPELMSSEFFDSVLSLERSKLDEDIFDDIQDDLNLSSDNCSNTEDVLSPQSFYSESASSENADEPVSLLPGLDNYDVPMLMSILDPVQNTQIDKQTTSTIKSSKPTKILIQNPHNKKIITKPLLYTGQVKNNSKTKPQILKVQSVSNGGRSVFLPLNVKSIKILNNNTDLTSISNVKKRKHVSDEEDVNVVTSTESQYQALALTAEEKRLLAKEGIQLPTHHPLTKNEERELKRIRRKIRNKISAQDSRKRKKEYIDGLEERVKRGSEENKNLLQRVKELQRQNKHLLAQVSKLQALICKSTTSKATPSTCLMVVLLSALLVSLPNIKLFEKQQMQNNAEQEQVAVRRSLLSSQTEDDNLNMEEFLVFNDDNVEFDGKFISDDLLENATGQEFTKLINEMNKKYDDLVSDKNNSKNSVFGKVVETIKHFLDRNGNADLNDYGGYQNKRGFIEPDIDDEIDEPAMKRIKITVDDFDIKNTDDNVVSTTLNTNKLVINSKNK